jgi:NhaA family Na+:H+ antiporter
LAAIGIIAVFYTVGLVMPALLGACACVAALAILNRARIASLWPYLAIGVVMWYCTLQSGVHATVAGVALALFVPREALRMLEHRLHPYVAFLILPVFGLFNAGVSFRGVTPSIAFGALPLGIVVGLFVGKQLGIFTAAWSAVRSGFVQLPHGVTWRMLYGVALLGGIGFTMSLFIGTLAFQSDALLTETKLGVFAGSLLSAAAGLALLRLQTRAT